MYLDLFFSSIYYCKYTLVFYPIHILLFTLLLIYFPLTMIYFSLSSLLFYWSSLLFCWSTLVHSATDKLFFIYRICTLLYFFGCCCTKGQSVTWKGLFRSAVKVLCKTSKIASLWLQRTFMNVVLVFSINMHIFWKAMAMIRNIKEIKWNNKMQNNAFVLGEVPVTCIRQTQTQ